MDLETFANGELGLSVRGKINGNFTIVEEAFNTIAIDAPKPSGGDDGPALTAAIAAAPNGSTLVLRQGATYLVGAGGILINAKQRLRIVAYGVTFTPTAQAATLLGAFGGSFRAFIRMQNCTSVRWEGGTMDMAGFGGESFAIDQCVRCELWYWEASNIVLGTGTVTAAGVTLAGGSFNRFRHVRVNGTSGNRVGIWIGNVGSASQPTTDFIGEYLAAENCSATGIAVAGTTRGYFIAPRGVGNGVGGSGAGMVVASGNSRTSRDILIEGATLEGNAWHGFQTDAAWASEADTLRAINIVGGSFRSNLLSGAYLANCRRVTITGGTYADNVDYGIDMPARSYEITVQGAHIHDTRSGVSRTQKAGLRVVSSDSALPCADIILANNSCLNHTSYGIQAQTSGTGTITNLQVRGGRASSNSLGGVFIAESSVNTITGAIVSGLNARGNTSPDIRATAAQVRVENSDYDTDNQAGWFPAADGDTSPSMLTRRRWTLTNTGATSITTLDDLPIGEVATLRATNGNTTLVHSANFALRGATNVTLAAGNIIQITRESATVLREIGRNF